MLIIKTKPKEITVTYNGGKFTFNAPSEQQEIQMQQELRRGDHVNLYPLFRLLLNRVEDIQDQDGKPITADQIKRADMLPGSLIATCLTLLFVECVKSREEEAKN